MADSNSLNSFTILGFVGKDARAFKTKSKQRKFTVIDICTQELYKGTSEPKIVWHQVQIWGTLMAPWAAGAVKRGMMVLSRGRIDYQYQEITDMEGKVHRIKISNFKVETFIILRSKKLEEPDETPAQATEPVPDPY